MTALAVSWHLPFTEIFAAQVFNLSLHRAPPSSRNRPAASCHATPAGRRPVAGVG